MTLKQFCKKLYSGQWNHKVIIGNEVVNINPALDIEKGNYILSKQDFIDFIRLQEGTTIECNQSKTIITFSIKD